MLHTTDMNLNELNINILCGDSETISGSFLLYFNDFGQYGFTMGSRYDNTRFLKGEISSLEIYHIDDTSKSIPECV